jgi:putative DNA methylase
MDQAPRKLIEVAFPLSEISSAVQRERKQRSTALHPFWGVLPRSLCQAVLWASLQDDPEAHPERFPTKAAQQAERKRLLAQLRDQLRGRFTPFAASALPPVLDPFCGSGTIPLAASSLGLSSIASDLNPVAVLLTRAQLDFPARFLGRAPIFPAAPGKGGHIHPLAGLSLDLLACARWIQDQLEQHLAPVYQRGPDVVLVWLWIHAGPCPRCGAPIPTRAALPVRSRRKPALWLRAAWDDVAARIRFSPQESPGGQETRPWRHCLRCGAPREHNRPHKEAQDLLLAAEVIKTEGGLEYRTPPVGTSSEPECSPWPQVSPLLQEALLPRQQRLYQLTADLIRERCATLRIEAGTIHGPDPRPLSEGGSGASAYAEAVMTYLALALDRLLDRHNRTVAWDPAAETVRAWQRPARPFAIAAPAERNPLLQGDFLSAVAALVRALQDLPDLSPPSQIAALDAEAALDVSPPAIISTDPPYYDNLGYGELSGLYYAALRPLLQEVHPDLFSAESPPGAQELSSNPVHHQGDRAVAVAAYQERLDRVLRAMRQAAHPDYPITLYGLVPPSRDASDPGRFDAIFDLLREAGLSITASWPLRMESTGRIAAIGFVEPSAILLVCRPSLPLLPPISRGALIELLKETLADSLSQGRQLGLTHPDQAHAASMAALARFARHEAVLDLDGTPLSTRAALQLIYQLLYPMLGPDTGSALPEQPRAQSDQPELEPEEPSSGQQRLPWTPAIPTISAPMVARASVNFRIDQLRLRNYKNFVACDVPLRPLTILLGPNGAGKSNLLDSLRFLSDSLKNGLDAEVYRRNGIQDIIHRGTRSSLTVEVALDFSIGEGRGGTYELHLAAQADGYRVELERCVVRGTDPREPEVSFQRAGELVTAPLLAEPPPIDRGSLFLSAVAGHPAFRPVYEALSRVAFCQPSLDALRQAQPSERGEVLRADCGNLASTLARLPTEQRARVLYYLRAVVPEIAEVHRRHESGGKETIEFLLGDEGGGGRFRAHSMSEGTLRVLAILVALFQQNYGPGQQQVPLLCLEEPETSLHPAAAVLLYDALSEASEKRQVLVTSHSPDLLDRKELDADALLAVSSEGGVARVGPIDEVARAAMRDELYTAGELLRRNRLHGEAEDLGG